MQIVYIFTVRVILCFKETLAVNRKPYDQKRIANFQRVF